MLYAENPRVVQLEEENEKLRRREREAKNVPRAGVLRRGCARQRLEIDVSSFLECCYRERFTHLLLL